MWYRHPFIRIPLGFAAFVAVVAVTLPLTVALPDFGDLHQFGAAVDVLLLQAPRRVLPVTLFSIVPFILSTIIAERISIRSLYYYLAVSLAPGVLFLIFLSDLSAVAGGDGMLLRSWQDVLVFAPLAACLFVGGLVWWAVAGRYAGDPGPVWPQHKPER